jgi:hypothetical protein
MIKYKILLNSNQRIFILFQNNIIIMEHYYMLRVELV